jgi:hypothetical protein
LLYLTTLSGSWNRHAASDLSTYRYPPEQKDNNSHGVNKVVIGSPGRCALADCPSLFVHLRLPGGDPLAACRGGTPLPYATLVSLALLHGSSWRDSMRRMPRGSNPCFCQPRPLLLFWMGCARRPGPGSRSLPLTPLAYPHGPASPLMPWPSFHSPCSFDQVLGLYLSIQRGPKRGAMCRWELYFVPKQITYCHTDKGASQPQRLTFRARCQIPRPSGGWQQIGRQLARVAERLRAVLLVKGFLSTLASPRVTQHHHAATPSVSQSPRALILPARNPQRMNDARGGCAVIPPRQYASATTSPAQPLNKLTRALVYTPPS